MFHFVHSFVPFRAKTLTPAITTSILHVINVTVCTFFRKFKVVGCSVKLHYLLATVES